jgi:ankyrin repeat protein
MSIHKSAKDGDIVGVRAALASGVAVDVRDQNDLTPLASAASNPSVTVEMLSLLIESGADVNADVKGGKTFPLTLAACSGNLEATRLLLDAGADVDATNNSGYSALVKCVYSLHASDLLLPIIAELVARGSDVDRKTDYGEIPLKVASHLRRFDAVRLLLESGAKKDPLGWSSLAEAVVLGSESDVARVLETTGLDSTTDHYGRTPGLLAATIGSTAKARILMSHGWDIDEQGEHGDTALMCSASSDQSEMTAWLLENGACTELADDSGKTALMLAAQKGADACVCLLVAAGARLDSRDKYGECAVELASTVGSVRELERSGADIGAVSTKIRRTLVGLSCFHTLGCSPDEYREGKTPRFGDGNPQRMEVPFWDAMVRAGWGAYKARSQNDDQGSLDTPVWTFSRYGCSFTGLPDGRFVQVAGEHEDYYDPDFCIYNDVVVHETTGEFAIYGYPECLFPPTDFHTATYLGGFIYVVGGLGYAGKRRLGVTPVYRLSCTDWSIEPLETNGDNPGCVYKHAARVVEPSMIQVSGGKVVVEENGRKVHNDLSGIYSLDVDTRRWKRVS